MQLKLKLLFSLGLLIAVLPARAHHQDAKSISSYTVYWKGIPPKSGSPQQITAIPTDIWKSAFVSTIQIAPAIQSVPTK
jgi:hypothetical protein